MEIITILYHLFVPWDFHNTAWVILIGIVYAVKVNQRWQNREKADQYTLY